MHCPNCHSTHLIKNGNIHNSLAGIVRVTGVSLRWLQYYINGKYAAVPRSVSVTEQKRGA
jgi:hypothetical protein